MNRRSFARRHMAGLGAVISAVVAAVMILATGLAAAAPLPQGGQGTLTFARSSGTDLDSPTFTTSAGCPDQANAYDVRLTGPANLDVLVIERSKERFSKNDPITETFDRSFKTAAAKDEPAKTIIAGTYTVTFDCVSGGSGQTVEGTFVGTVEFSSPTAWTTTQVTPTTSVAPTTSVTTSPTSTTSADCTTTVTTSPTTSVTATTSITATTSVTATTSPTSTTSATATTSDTATTSADCTTDTTSVTDTSDSGVATSVTPTSAAAPTGPPLAYTGAPVAELVYLGGGLIVLGLFLIALTRRRARR